MNYYDTERGREFEADDGQNQSARARRSLHFKSAFAGAVGMLLCIEAGPYALGLLPATDSELADAVTAVPMEVRQDVQRQIMEELSRRTTPISVREVSGLAAKAAQISTLKDPEFWRKARDNTAADQEWMAKMDEALSKPQPRVVSAPTN